MSERDVLWREQVTDSCRVVKSHASFIGQAATEIKSMPDFHSSCMDELDEAESVLKRAIARVQATRQALISKPKAA